MWPVFAAVLPAGAVIALIYLRGQFGWLAWPFVALSAIFGFYAWRLYDVEGAERSFVRASIAALLHVSSACSASRCRCCARSSRAAASPS